MFDLKSPLDLLGIALAAVLLGLGVVQYQKSVAFDDAAVATEATVVDVETRKRGLLDGAATAIATVEFEVDGRAQRSPMAEPLQHLGLSPTNAVGKVLSVRYDPSNPAEVHYGTQTGREGAKVLLLLALGALFAPFFLRRIVLAPGGG